MMRCRKPAGSCVRVTDAMKANTTIASTPNTARAFRAAALERERAEHDVDDESRDFRGQPRRICAEADHGHQRERAQQQQRIDDVRHDLRRACVEEPRAGASIQIHRRTKPAMLRPAQLM